MRVFVLRDDTLHRVPGPADLRHVPPALLVLDGDPIPGDHARWGGALGGASLRGSEIRWNNAQREEEER